MTAWPSDSKIQTVARKPTAVAIFPSGRARNVLDRHAAGRDLAEVKEAIVAEFPSVFQDAPSQCTSTCAATPCPASTTGLAQCHFSDETQWRHSFRRWCRKASLKKSQWVSRSRGATRMVVVPKKSSAEPRITVDLTGLNKYVERPAYPTRVPSEVVASVNPGMEYFTTLDSRHGYWQIPLDEASFKLTTFITPWRISFPTQCHGSDFGRR